MAFVDELSAPPSPEESDGWSLKDYYLRDLAKFYEDVGDFLTPAALKPLTSAYKKKISEAGMPVASLDTAEGIMDKSKAFPPHGDSPMDAGGEFLSNVADPTALLGAGLKTGKTLLSAGMGIPKVGRKGQEGVVALYGTLGENPNLLRLYRRLREHGVEHEKALKEVYKNTGGKLIAANPTDLLGKNFLVEPRDINVYQSIPSKNLFDTQNLPPHVQRALDYAEDFRKKLGNKFDLNDLSYEDIFTQYDIARPPEIIEDLLPTLKQDASARRRYSLNPVMSKVFAAMDQTVAPTGSNKPPISPELERYKVGFNWWPTRLTNLGTHLGGDNPELRVNLAGIMTRPDKTPYEALKDTLGHEISHAGMANQYSFEPGTTKMRFEKDLFGTDWPTKNPEMGRRYLGSSQEVAAFHGGNVSKASNMEEALNVNPFEQMNKFDMSAEEINRIDWDRIYRFINKLPEAERADAFLRIINDLK